MNKTDYQDLIAVITMVFLIISLITVFYFVGKNDGKQELINNIGSGKIHIQSNITTNFFIK